MDMTVWTLALQESLTESFGTLVAFLPKVLAALVLLVTGFILGKLLAGGLSRALALIGADRLLNLTGLTAVLEHLGVQRPVSQLLGSVAFWVTFLLFLIAAVDSLELNLLTSALTALAGYLPQVGAAILILFLGIVGASFLRDIIQAASGSVGTSQGRVLAQAIYAAVLLVVVVTALTELGIDTTMVNALVLVIVTGVIAGVALSFGLGARTAMANLIAGHYLHPILKVGDRIQVSHQAGRVTAITPLAVLVETDEGRILLPASQLTDGPLIIRSSEPGDSR